MSWASVFDPRTYEGKGGRLVLGAALLASVAYYLAAAHYGGTGHATPPLADSYIFHQYARSIAEGHPLVFSPGDAPTTGSTSLAYPFVLAAFYFLGATGAALGSAAFLLGALCHAATLLLAWELAKRLAPGAAPLAAALAATSGHLAFASFNGMDTSLFMPLALAAWLAALERRAALAAAALACCSLVRPEGAMISGLLFAACLVPAPGEADCGERAVRWRMLAAAATGLSAYGIVLAVNFAFTGTTSFHSVMGKGHLANNAFPFAATLALEDLGRIVRELCFGLAAGGRQYLAIPLVGGALAVVGLLPDAKASRWVWRIEAWWFLVLLATTALACSSGWAGIQFDRYFAWLIPAWMIWQARGAARLLDRLERAGAARRAVAIGGAATLIAWQAAGFAWFWAKEAGSCAYVAEQVACVEEMRQSLPPDAAVGVLASSGLAAYHMPGRVTRNPFGIVSPEFAFPDHPACAVEVFRRRPDLRFAYWLAESADPDFAPFFGRETRAQATLLAIAPPLKLYEATWDALLDESLRPTVMGGSIIDSLDFGYPADETSKELEIEYRRAGIRAFPFVHSARWNGATMCETGRACAGAMRFRLKTKPNERALLAIRVSRAATPNLGPAGGAKRPTTLPPGSGLALLANGRAVAKASLRTDVSPRDFQEVVLHIPADAIGSEEIEVELLGDFFVYACWLLQP